MNVKKVKDPQLLRRVENMEAEASMMRDAIKKESIIKISREEYDLLQTTYKDVVYYIKEGDGSVTIEEGEF